MEGVLTGRLDHVAQFDDLAHAMRHARDSYVVLLEGVHQQAVVSGDGRCHDEDRKDGRQQDEERREPGLSKQTKQLRDQARRAMPYS